MAAIGYRHGADDRLEQDPDRRLHETLSMVFRKFSEIGSVRQLALWLRQEGIGLPVAIYDSQGRAVASAALPAAHRLLTNPVYAGALCLGAPARKCGSKADARSSFTVSRVGGRSGRC